MGELSGRESNDVTEMRETMQDVGSTDVKDDRGLIYRSPRLYALVMFLLYRRSYRTRLDALAALIPPGASVVEACCGTGSLYLNYLRDKRVQYTGLDLSPAFVSALETRGVDARIWDIRSPAPLPHADHLVMQASLYHFLPDPEPIIDRMLRAAREQVLVAEPIRNLTTDYPRLSRIFAALSNAGAGPERERFDEESLDRFFAKYENRVRRTMLTPGGREKLYVLEGQAGAESFGP